MAEPLNVPSCLVTGRFVDAQIDGRDEDRDPDGVPWVGLDVTITATRPWVQTKTSDPPTLITLHTITARTDSTGTLVGPDGEPGVYVVASDSDLLTPSGTWYYQAVVTGPGFPTYQIDFVARSDGEYDLIRDASIPLDLTAALPEWQAAVDTMKALIANFEGTATAVLG